MLGQGGPQPCERPECVGLTAAAVQRQYQLSPATLSQGLFSSRGFQVTHHGVMVARLQPGLGQLLLRCPAQLLEPGDLRRRPRVLVQVWARPPPPQRQRPAETKRSRGRVACLPVLGRLLHRSFEAAGVGRLRVDPEHVPAACRQDAAGRKRPAQMGDVRLEGLGGRRGRRLAPKARTQRLDRYRSPRS